MAKELSTPGDFLKTGFPFPASNWSGVGASYCEVFLMSAKKSKAEKEVEKTGDITEKEEIVTEVEDEFEYDDDEEEYEYGIETEIEHQTPEVIAKELLITYLEANAFAQPDNGPGENRYQATGRAIGEIYNALLEEIRKTAF